MRSTSQPASYARILELPRGSFFLFGPRGIGKSTWARRCLAHAKRFDLLDEGLYQDLLRNPLQFRDELRTLAKSSWVVVDEIQRIPSLLNEVHRSIEEFGLRFVLLGSSSRKLKTQGTNLLAGRAARKLMFPFTPQELGRDFRLEDQLRFGSIPLVFAAEDRIQALTSYVQLYLKEEIRAEALVRNLPAFARFLPVAALFHGQVINISNIARETATARMTVAGYLEILDDTLLTYRLPAFEARLRVRERKLPKLYWVDPGLVRAVKKQLGLVTDEERGPLFEGWVLTLLRTYAEVGELYDEVWYWSPSDSKVEVDFLLRRGRSYLAIEVKSQRRVAALQLSGLKAIGELKSVARRVLVYPGERDLKTQDGVEIWSIARFVQALAEGQLWPE